VPFRHGVASGDPLPHGVVIWTRCTPEREPGPERPPEREAGPERPPERGAPPAGVPVAWRIARDPAMDDVVAAGEAEARAERDFTVKVDVGGLEPATTYHYRFEAAGEASPVGRTRTAPEEMAAGLRLGLVSCASYSAGYFNAYRNLARRHLDLVVHVGDYLYEGLGVMRGRRVRRYPPGGPAITLDQYRARHALHKADPDLQALHVRHPMVAVWDDHEVAGGSWRGGAAAHQPAHGNWQRRREAAVQAYAEWMPLRLPDPSDPARIHRTVHLGGLADLMMLETRLAGRDRPPGGEGPVLAVVDRHRSLLGAEQRDWLHRELRSSTARWKLVGNQVMMAPLRVLHVGIGLGVNPTQWDGYPGERAALFRFLEAEGLQVVVLSGDLHSSWASDLPGGVEFVTPSVTSPSFAASLLPRFPGATRLATGLLRWQNRHVRLADLEHHGYVVVDVTQERVQADWWHVETVTERSDREHYGGGWLLRHGSTALVRADGPVGG